MRTLKIKTMIKKLPNVVLWVFLLLLFQNCKQEEISMDLTRDFENMIAEEIDLQHIPALAVLIFKENTILYENYFGYSNVQNRIPLTRDDIFLLASISKVVTATALLQLFDAGYFALDDPINDYLPFRVSVPNYNQPITFRMLLTHTSGIADGPLLYTQYYYGQDSPTPLHDFLKSYLVPGGAYYNATENFHDFTPGTNFSYSNAGSALIGVLVEQLSKTDFNSYCKKNIFQPLKMNHTYWRLEEAFQANASIAQPYRFNNNQYQPIQHYTFTDYPNGGLRSSPRDMHKLLTAFVQNGMSNNYPLLKASTINTMLTPQFPTINREVGLHLFLMQATNNLWGHSGSESGVATILAFNANTKVGAIIFTNQKEVNLSDILAEAYALGLKL